MTKAGKGERVTCLSVSMGVEWVIVRILSPVNASQVGLAQTLQSNAMLASAARQTLCVQLVTKSPLLLAPVVRSAIICTRNKTIALDAT